jgi:hypothetical protein
MKMKAAYILISYLKSVTELHEQPAAFVRESKIDSQEDALGGIESEADAICRLEF